MTKGTMHFEYDGICNSVEFSIEYRSKKNKGMTTTSNVFVVTFDKNDGTFDIVLFNGSRLKKYTNPGFKCLKYAKNFIIKHDEILEDKDDNILKMQHLIR